MGRRETPSVVASIERALHEAIRFESGEDTGARVYVVHVPKKIDVRAIRRRQKLTQSAFARRYGFALSALRDWEQGRRQPERSARILLRVIEHEPEAVERALAR
jgi:putative transcriptional regulator